MEDKINLTLILNNTAIIKIRYSIKPREYMKKDRHFYHLVNKLVHGQLMLLKMSVIRIIKKLIDSAKKSTPDAIKTTSKKAIPETADETVDLIGKKISWSNKKYFKISTKCFKRIVFKDRRE